jgi:NAD(P)-dependent dehydrogenase (short-subunit alcohol dehydrogenase family)
MKLSKKTAIITGAASGIGKSIAIEFAKEGAQVVIVDVTKQGQDTVEEIKQFNGRAIFVEADIRFDHEVEKMVSIANKAYGKIDILVNNAGVSIRKNALEAEEKDWDTTMTINLKGAWLCCKHAIPFMIEKGGGSIINNISPGFIMTPLAAKYINEFPNSDEKINRLLSTHPSQRLGKPEDVARAAVFLASDDASYIYGANLIVDGGRSVFQTS